MTNRRAIAVFFTALAFQGCTMVIHREDRDTTCTLSGCNTTPNAVSDEPGQQRQVGIEQTPIATQISETPNAPQEDGQKQEAAEAEKAKADEAERIKIQAEKDRLRALNAASPEQHEKFLAAACYGAWNPQGCEGNYSDNPVDEAAWLRENPARAALGEAALHRVKEMKEVAEEKAELNETLASETKKYGAYSIRRCIGTGSVGQEPGRISNSCAVPNPITKKCTCAKGGKKFFVSSQPNAAFDNCTDMSYGCATAATVKKLASR